MKAHEVLKRYADGRRDFSGENLRGQLFKGKNLSGANFSEADIRGANFTNAMLTGANFKGAKAGLQRRWATGLVIGLWVLSGLSGIYALLLGVLLSESSNSFQLIIISCFALIVFAVSWLVNIRKGLVLGLKPFTIVGALARAVALSFAFAFAATFAGAFIFAVVGAFAGAVTRTPTVGVAAAITGTVTVISSYIGWRTLTGDEEHSGFREFAIAFAAIGGTSFRNADLTDADFTSATLKSTDFRRANLTRTYWHQAKMLDRARPGTTYLQLPKVQQLLMTGQGQAQNFDRQPLRGVNLQGANLADASFIGTDLNEANLQDADLSRAKLVQTQLDETDLTGATLTGAYIEDWGITSHTKLDGVRCEYVFMRLPTKEDPEPRRKPDNRNETFKDGDFADFIKPIVDTLDLYHNQDVDPRAIAISFKQLAENHPESELDIVGMEKRGGDKFMLRVATAPDANHSELNAEYFTTYDEINALAKQEIKSLLDEKDSLISRLENMVATVLQRPSFYTSNYHGDINMSESKGNINITSGEGSKISGIAGAGENMTNTGSTIGEINGTVSIAINQLPASSESGKPGLKELLVQLQTAINDPNLAEDDKTQALEQIKVLAEAGQNPKNETTQKQAKKAIGFLKVIAEGLPSAASLVKTCQDLLPAIALYFGF